VEKMSEFHFKHFGYMWSISIQEGESYEGWSNKGVERPRKTLGKTIRQERQVKPSGRIWN
jgi:hypothetical protein